MVPAELKTLLHQSGLAEYFALGHLSQAMADVHTYGLSESIGIPADTDASLLFDCVLGRTLLETTYREILAHGNASLYHTGGTGQRIIAQEAVRKEAKRALDIIQQFIDAIPDADTGLRARICGAVLDLSQFAHCYTDSKNRGDTRRWFTRIRTDAHDLTLWIARWKTV